MSNMLRKQIKTCFESDLVEECKIVWVYLVACKSVGAGTATLSKSLGIDVTNYMDILLERGMVEKAELHNGGKVWRAVKFAITSKKTPKGDTKEPVMMSDKVKAFISVYQRLRVASMGRELPMNTDRLAHMKKITEWMSKEDVQVVPFMRFAINRSDWLRDSMPFPTPNWLAGKWIREQWNDSKASILTASSRISPDHAGKTYAEAGEDVKTVLETSGLDITKISGEKLRYIEASVQTCIEIGTDIHSAGIDPSMIKYVEVLYNYKCQRR